MATLTGNPYVGPRTFRPDEKDRFFGRDREARDLTALIVSNRLVLFYAPSGAGKSSLLNTMVGPSLSDQGFEVLPTGRVSGFSGDEVTADNVYAYNLLLSLHQRDTTPDGFETLTLIDFLDNLVLHADGSACFDPAYVYPPDTEFKPRVLIVDQFEELVTTSAGLWQQRAGFFQQLTTALEQDDQLWVVLAMREDFVARLDPFLHLTPNRLRHRYYMERLTRSAALQAIRLPARSAGRPFEEAAAQGLVDDLRRIRGEVGGTAERFDQFVEPVQLQAVCYQMWQKLSQRSGATITVADVEQYADVDTALVNFYEDTVAKTTQETGVSEIDLRAWFDRELITEAGTRNMVFRGEETTGGLATAVADHVRGQFILREVVRPGGTWYELVHDRFVPPILEANQAWLQEQPLLQLAQAWEDGGRREGQLLSGGQLAQLDDGDWRPLGPLVADFVTVSQEAAAAEKEAQRERELAQQRELAAVQRQRAEEAGRSARRQRRLTVAVGALMVVALIAAGIAAFFAAEANQNANTAEAARGKAEAEAARAATAEADAVKAAEARATEVVIRTTAEAEALAQAALAETRRIDALNEADARATEAVVRRTAEASAIEQANIAATREAEAFAARNAAEVAAMEVERLAAVSAAQRLTAQSVNLRQNTYANDELAVLLNIEAHRLNRDNQGGATGQIDNNLRAILNDALFSTVVNAHQDGGQVLSVAFSVDRQQIASVSGTNNSQTVRVWDLADPTAPPLALSGHTGLVNAVAFSPNGQRLASGSNDQTVRVWDLADPTTPALVLRGHAGWVRSVAFSPEGTQIASGSADQTVRVWDLSDPAAEPLTLSGHTDSVTTVAFSPDGQRLASGSNDQTVRVWDLADPTTPALVLRGHAGWVRSVAFSPDGTQIASGSQDQTVRVWDVGDPAADEAVLHGHASLVNSVAFSPDGTQIASGSADQTVRVWPVANLAAEPLVLSEHTDWVNLVAFSANGRQIVSVSGHDTVRVWELATRAADPLVLIGHTDSFLSVAFSPDGQRVASGSADQTVQVWDLADPAAEPLVLRGHTDVVTSVAFSPDGRHVASGGSWDKTVRVWDLADPAAEPLVLSGHIGRVNSVAFSPDGRHIASGGGHPEAPDPTVRVWDLANPAAEPLVIPGPTTQVLSVAFSPDGRHIASASGDQTVRVWDLEDPAAEPLMLVGNLWTVISVAFSPDNRHIASGSADLGRYRDDTVRVWDIANPTAEPLMLIGHTRNVNSVAFSPDGRQIASASYSEDGTVRVWDLADPGAEPTVLSGHAGRVNSVAFSPDGRHIASASEDGTVRVWPVNDGLVTIGCHKVRRNLTWGEWQRYLTSEEEYRCTCANLPPHPSALEAGAPIAAGSCPLVGQ